MNMTRVAISIATVAAVTTGARAQVVLDGNVIDGTGSPAQSSARVVVVDDAITCVGTPSSCAAPPGAQHVALDGGAWILPGLVDAHVHFGQTGWFDGRPNSLDVTDRFPYEQTVARLKTDPDRYYRSYLCTGVTAVFDTGGYPWSLDLKDDAERNPFAPHVVAAGPRITHAPPAALNLPAAQQYVFLSSEAAGRAAVRFNHAFGSDAIKIWFLRVPEGEQRAIDARVRAVAEEATRRGLPLIVHATTLREAKVALRAGVHLLVHGVDDQPVDDEFLSLAKASGTIYTPTLLVSGGYLRMFEGVKGVRTPDIVDPNRCMDEETRAKIEDSPSLVDHPSVQAYDQDLNEYRARLGAAYERKVANLLRVHRAGIPIAVGTDAGNPGTFHGPAIYRELDAMQSAGIPAEDLLVMATQNGARAMVRDDLSTIVEGNVADLIIVSRNPLEDINHVQSITHVMRAGRLHRVEALSSR